MNLKCFTKEMQSLDLSKCGTSMNPVTFIVVYGQPTTTAEAMEQLVRQWLPEEMAGSSPKLR
jgi:hypothetical protein